MSDPGNSGAIMGRIDPEQPIQTHLARALLPLVRARRTGAFQLVVGAPPVRTQLVLVDGTIAFAESDADASLLLARLVDAGALGPTQAMRIERRVFDDRGWSGVVKASELAVSEGNVRPEVAMTAVSEVVRGRVESCLRIADGQWIYRDDPRAAAVPRYAVTFEKAVLDALAHPDCAPRFERALARYASRYPKLDGDRGENTTLFGMTPARFRTLRLLDGVHTLAEVLAQSPLGATEAAALIAGLTIFERIWWNAEPVARTPSGASAVAPQARPRPVTIERPPTAIDQLRALGRARAATPPPGRPVTPTPGPSDPRAIAELLRRGAPRAPSEIKPPGAAPASSAEQLSARGYFDRGRAHLAAGRIGPAGTDFTHAAQLEPDDLVFRLHARFAAHLQAPAGPSRKPLDKELHELASELARGDSPEPFALHVLGRLYFEAGEDDKALRAFKSAERLAPRDVENLRYLRLLAARMKR
jgi:tetratricopeptide (TPR) repeat protein